jgi:hypothetical protein
MTDRQILDEAIEMIDFMKSSLRSIKSVYNEHEDLLTGSGIRYDLNNLWIAIDYLEQLKKIQSKCE